MKSVVAILLPIFLSVPASADPMNPQGVTMAHIEEAWRGHSYEAVTKGLGFVQGAIVCHADGGSEGDAFRTAGFMSELWGEATVTSSLPASTRALIETYGDSMQSKAPNLEAYGCVMIKPGHRVLVANWIAFPWIATEVDGRVIIGATLAPMVGR